MEQLPKVNNKEIKKSGAEKNLSRRKLLKTSLGIAGAAVLQDLMREKAAAQEESGSAAKHEWFYTIEETEKVYEEEYKGKRIENFLRKEDEKIIGRFGNKEFSVPPEFVEKTLRHLREMLEKGMAKFLFRLDAGHAHFFMPEKIYEEEYKQKTLIGGLQDLLKAIQKGEDIGALYHNSEHLTAKDPETGKINDKAFSLMEKRNVIGWYDGRPLKIIPPSVSAELFVSGAGPPKRYRGYLDFDFAANREGEFVIETDDGRKIRLDISFESSRY